ncbi:MAG: hypothetical protein AB6733_21135 [Clostridiaceae bacterium]
MNAVLTRCGNIKGVILEEFYPSGSLKECTLDQKNEIKTNYGLLVPSYENDDLRRKYTRSLSFYETGELKSISLQDQKLISTKIGNIPAELITFHKNGNIKRIFPLNGKISGYWTEEDEYNLAEEIKIDSPLGELKTRASAIQMYDNEDVKSISLWPNDTLNIKLPVGSIEVRYGVSFYSDGKVKSLEPNQPTLIETPIGSMMVYDTTALGIHGDRNSLSFYEDGRIESLVSATDQVDIIDKDGNKTTVKHTLKQNLFNLEVMDIVPLSVEFFNDKVRFNKDKNFEFVIGENAFIINHKPLNVAKCGDCANCNGCG